MCDCAGKETVLEGRRLRRDSLQKAESDIVRSIGGLNQDRLTVRSEMIKDWWW